MPASSSHLSPNYRRYNQSRRYVKDADNETVEFNEEREEEEYIYALQRAPSTASDTATMQFLTDDRLDSTTNQRRVNRRVVRDEDEREDRYRTDIIEGSTRGNGRKDDWNNNNLQPISSLNNNQSRRVVHEEDERESIKYSVTREFQRHYDRPSTAGSSANRDMSVDYSTQDFQRSRAVIDAAAKQENVRVRQVGDTTIVSEHRDPYSFYWQLDQVRKKEEEPPRRKPPSTDYVIDEEEIIQETAVLSPDSHDSGVNFESQYSKPVKEEVRQLPSGWEKHEDPSGFSYYWHVDSGTIQREPPPAKIIPREATPEPPAQPIIEEHAFKQITTKRQIENQDEETNVDYIDEDGKKPVRFLVRSLGWTEISENDLTADRSSRAVNKAIIDLSSGSQDTPKWGNGKELIMELNDRELLLVDSEKLQNVHSERIQNIRVWGVGRDNGRDFAYVARDPASRRFLCHVFRCDTPARAIANSLRDICKRLMAQRQQPQSFTPASEQSERRIIRESSMAVPIDEVRRTIRCHFLGVTQVPRATGIDILNEAVDRLVSQVRPERWLLTDVAIALSHITITEVNGDQIAQCRVRYLSFLGIGHDIKYCAFIIHTSNENFMCYVFHVEPSAATMAKTIEGACKLRYQKILDANIPKSHLQNDNRIRYYDY
ncbi:hypothetical protein M3Y97_00891100 [Aphelenchoides bicaudatus]|nr:hypothetical protein M3Y97_00891100 [Aphelenchoides bicaudatus]